MNWDFNAWDLARVFIIVMYCLGFAETAVILKAYGKVMAHTRRLLPRHVAGVSIALLGLESVAIWQTIERVGEGFGSYVVINAFLLTLAWWSLRTVRLHLTRKADVHQEILPLIQEPKEQD